MVATAFEFKYRAWIITALYLVALACFRFDRRDIGFTVAGALAGLIPVLVTARFFYLTGALLVFFAAFLSTWTAAYSHEQAAGTTQRDLVNRNGNGPHRFMRHPVYLATVLLFLGFGLLLNPFGLALLMAGMAVLICRLLRRDEGLATESKVAGWGRALLQKAHLWAFGATLATLAITLQERAFYIALAISLLIQAASFLQFRRIQDRHS